MSEAYFEGKFFETYEKHLKTISKNNCAISNRIMNWERKDDGSAYTWIDLKCERAVIDTLMSYIHSPLQTRRGRMPLSSTEAKEHFAKILEHVELRFYVEQIIAKHEDGNKVLLPRRRLVSSLLYIYTICYYIFYL